MRLARNSIHVAKMKGRRGYRLQAIMGRFQLSMDDALEVVGRDRAWRRTRG